MPKNSADRQFEAYTRSAATQNSIAARSCPARIRVNRDQNATNRQ